MSSSANNLVAMDSSELPEDSSIASYFLHKGPFFTPFKPLDTSFKAFKEMEYFEMYPALYLSNAGHAAYGVLYNRKTFQPSLTKGFDHYFRKKESVRYFSTNKPHSELTYLNGAKREQNFNLLHTQNFGKFFNIKLDLTKSNSEGFFSNLKTNNTFFDFSTNYISKNKHYRFQTFYYLNRINAQENGGYKNFDEVKKPSLSSGVYLKDAVTRMRDQRYYTRHAYRFGKTTKYLDQDTVERKSFRPFIEIAYAFQYAKREKMYEDNRINFDFYQLVAEDSIKTFDSIFQREFENEMTFSILNGQYAFLGLSAGHQFFYHCQTRLVDSSYNNYFLGGFLHKKFNSSEWSTDGRYYTQGYNEDDLFIRSSFSRIRSTDSTGKVPLFSLEARYSLREPDYFLTRYASNNFIWNNRFKKVKTIDFNIQLDWYKFFLKMDHSMLSDLVLFGENAEPVQLNQEINVTALTLGRDIELGHFVLENKFSFQSSSDEKQVPLPTFVVNETFFYRNHLFKKALLTRIGVNYFYYGKHQAYAYMPALSQFHVNGENTQLQGAYPYFNFFVDLKVKRMKIYFMFTHANKGFTGKNFYRIPNYPMPPRAFKFGLNWKLFP